MTDTQVSRLQKGQQVHERWRGGCLALTVNGTPRRAPDHINHEVFAVSERSGALIVRVTCGGDFHLPGECG